VPLRPKRPELLEETVFDEPDPAIYDRLYTGLGDTTDAAPSTHSSDATAASLPVTATTSAPSVPPDVSPEEPTHARSSAP
jgi:hypothetical protein